MSSASVQNILIIIASSIVFCNGSKFASVEKTFEKGVNAYGGERWSECITQFEESLHLYKLYKTVFTNCRLKCNSEQYKSQIKENMEDLKIFERFFNIKECLNKCQEKGTKDVFMMRELDDDILTYMETRKPYDYLHVCYFQMYMLPKAASAAYTYLVANPNDENMKGNLEYYVKQPEVDINEVTDLQSEDYEELYRLGVSAHKKKLWGETIAMMEEAISKYLMWENSCRVECDRQPNQELSPEFVITISINIASLLHCRQECPEKLKRLGYSNGVEFLADVLNYLQISYYHMNKYEDAAKGVTSYLALLPNDEDMIENKKIYSSLTGENAFTIRPEIDNYIKRDMYEKNLLVLFHNGDRRIFNSESS